MKERGFYTEEQIQAGKIDLIQKIKASWALNSEQVAATASFWECLVKENELQNLTRNTSPDEFLENHLLDVVEWMTFRQERCLDGPFCDVGSGSGVPGLLAAAIDPVGDWILVESEIHKAEYLKRTVAFLGLDARVKVMHGRFENAGRKIRPQVVMARAVAALPKLIPMVSACSTWNMLVFFKGPRWTQEWDDYKQSITAKEEDAFKKGPKIPNLSAPKTKDYTTSSGKSRVLLQFERIEVQAEGAGVSTQFE